MYARGGLGETPILDPSMLADPGECPWITMQALICPAGSRQGTTKECKQACFVSPGAPGPSAGLPRTFYPLPGEPIYGETAGGRSDGVRIESRQAPFTSNLVLVAGIALAAGFLLSSGRDQ